MILAFNRMWWQLAAGRRNDNRIKYKLDDCVAKMNGNHLFVYDNTVKIMRIDIMQCIKIHHKTFIKWVAIEEWIIFNLKNMFSTSFHASRTRAGKSLKLISLATWMQMEKGAFFEFEQTKSGIKMPTTTTTTAIALLACSFPDCREKCMRSRHH